MGLEIENAVVGQYSMVEIDVIFGAVNFVQFVFKVDA